LFVWGLNSSGQLGTNNVASRSSPVQVTTSSFSMVSAGDLHTLAITTAGNLLAWGLGTSGQVGDATLTSRSSPVLISSGGWTEVNAGYSSSVGIQSGELYAWGLGTSGQLGLNNAASQSVPVQVGLLNTWTKAVAGSLTTGAINSDNILYMWGASPTGEGTTINKSSPTQIGNNLEINTLSPVQIAGSWSAVSAGNSFTLAKDTNGTIYAWGQDTSGQLGI
jgi:alpha-tubulin suppressor-like RCC1 family protein